MCDVVGAKLDGGSVWRSGEEGVCVDREKLDVETETESKWGVLRVLRPNQREALAGCVRVGMCRCVCAGFSRTSFISIMSTTVLLLLVFPQPPPL